MMMLHNTSIGFMLMFGCFVCNIRSLEGGVDSINIHNVICADTGCCHGVLLEYCKEFISLKNGCMEKFESATSNKETQNACFVLYKEPIIRTIYCFFNPLLPRSSLLAPMILPNSIISQ